LKSQPQIQKEPPKVPLLALNQTVPEKAKFGFLKQVHEQYNGDDSDEFEDEKFENPTKLPETKMNFGMPLSMSKTFDVS